MKKILSLLFALVLIVSCAGVSMPVKAEGDDLVIAEDYGFTDILFSNGYRGFCVDMNMSGASANDDKDKFTVTSASDVKSNIDGRNVSQNIKKLFVYYFESLFEKVEGEYIFVNANESLVQSIIWNYTDNRYLSENQLKVKEKIEALGEINIPNDGYQIQHSSGDIITFYFKIMQPVNADVQDFFAYKFSVTPSNASPTSSMINIVWDDADNEASKRPDNLSVTLSNGLGLTLNEANNWSVKIENLPRDNASGQAIAYTWTVGTLPEGYSVSSSITEDTVTTVTLSYEEDVPEETVEASVKVVWDDAENQDGKRPENLVATLSNGTEVTLNEENDWNATVENLSKNDEVGEEIVYTWTIRGLSEGYNLTTSDVEGEETVLTYNYTPKTTTVSGSLVWNDCENQDGKRPEKVIIELLADGEKVDETEISEVTTWKWVFAELPKYKAGNEIEYSIVEPEMEEYEVQVEGDIFVATYIPETIDLIVKFVWDDEENQAGKRPTSLNVFLNDEGPHILSEGNNWTLTVSNLPKYEAGEEIQYTWIVSELPEGYTSQENEEADNITVFTSTYESQKPVGPSVPGGSGEGGAEVEPSEPQNPTEPQEPTEPGASEEGEKEEMPTVPDEPKNPQGGSPDTGDYSNISYYLIMFVAASLAIIQRILACAKQK